MTDTKDTKIADCQFCTDPITDDDWERGEVADTPHGQAHNQCWWDEIEARQRDADLYRRGGRPEIYD